VTISVLGIRLLRVYGWRNAASNIGINNINLLLNISGVNND